MLSLLGNTMFFRVKGEAGETEPVRITKVGPDLVFGRLWKTMGLEEIVRDLAGERRAARGKEPMQQPKRFVNMSDRFRIVVGVGAQHEKPVIAFMVEDTFRTAKSILETRPIYHKSDDTIRGHVFCSFLALCLKRELEIRLEDKGLEAEWKEIVRGLDNLHKVEATLQGQGFIFRSTLCGDALPAIRAAGAALPPTIRESA